MPQKRNPRLVPKRASSAKQYPGLSERTALVVRNSSRSAFAERLAGLGLPEETIQSALADFDRQFPAGKVEVADSRPMADDYPEGKINLPPQPGSGLINPLPKEFRNDLRKQVGRGDARPDDSSLRMRKYVEQQVEVYSRKQRSASEGFIDQGDTTDNFRKANQTIDSAGSLPMVPPRLWKEDFRGKSKSEKAAVLIAFLEDVYGPYFSEHRSSMRDYLREKDPSLHQAIKNYGFASLPEHLQMPSMRDRLKERIQRAAAGEYDAMTEAERRSVRGAVKRLENSPKS